MELYKLADELNIPSIDILKVLDNLQISYKLPNPEISKQDAKKIRNYYKKKKFF